MAEPNPAEAPTRNRILALLPRDEYEALLAHLEPITLEFKKILYNYNEPIRYVYFVTHGVGSLLASADGDPAVEIATVGHEGIVGLPVFLGATFTPGRAIMQIPGAGVRMDADRFREAASQSAALRDALYRYTLSLFTQMAQTAACNRLHSAEQRCARWLLQTHDRVEKDQFSLTHEFLSQMLGLRRATVTEVAGALQAAGLIRYQRGIITVVDRAGLEAASCECYAIIRAEFNRLMGTDG